MQRNLPGFLAAYTAYVVALHTADGPWRRWPRSGAVDAWTATHVVWGALARRYGLTAQETVAAALANELVELWAHRNRPDLVWGQPETPANRVVDVLTTWAGWSLG